MDLKEYTAFLQSPSGRFALSTANYLLQTADPETADAVLVRQVEALGFPWWAALRVFLHCTNRYAPMNCRDCGKEFRPRSVFTIDRPYCHQCVKPTTPEQEVKKLANRLAGSAEYKGKIKRKPCEECGTTVNLHKHHPDYSRPLFVKWLCARCHKAEHKKLRETA